VEFVNISRLVVIYDCAVIIIKDTVLGSLQGCARDLLSRDRDESRDLCL